jgi:hypothetical protein
MGDQDERRGTMRAPAMVPRISLGSPTDGCIERPPVSLQQATRPEGQYDHVVSLGRGCQPAHQIRRIRGVGPAQVFDWIVTTDRGLVAHIASNLDGFFARSTLVYGPEGCVIDRTWDTRFLHEFSKGSDFAAKHAEHAERFAHLVERWRALLASRQRVLFVRQHGWDDDTRGSAVRLREAITQQAPGLRFAILYLTARPDDDKSWGETQIINRRLTQPDPYDWRGDTAVWQRLLDEAGAPAPLVTSADGRSV